VALVFGLREDRPRESAPSGRLGCLYVLAALLQREVQDMTRPLVTISAPKNGAYTVAIRSPVSALHGRMLMLSATAPELIELWRALERFVRANGSASDRQP
jgi:hypothetical protein